MIRLLGCQACGVVTREDSLEGRGPGCPECGRNMEPVSLTTGRAMVAARRRADDRRVNANAMSDLGLRAAEPR